MRALPIAVSLLAGCCKAPAAPDGEPAPNKPGTPAIDLPDSGSLAGYYRGAGGSRLCVTERGRERHFAFVTATRNGNCSGSGTMTRQRNGRIAVRLSGESRCAFSAGVDDKGISFPAAVPSGCAYYCGTKASLAGVRFDLAERGNTATAQARDLVDEPLCRR